jgi:5'-3' exonuclease
MIIIDYSAISLANVFSHQSMFFSKEKNVIDENLTRHTILNSIRMYNFKYNSEFGSGEIVLACDSGNNWRKKYFPHYKALRKEKRAKSGLDWSQVFNVLNKIRDEISENVPVKVLTVDSTEADDIIAVLTKKNINAFPAEPTLIVGSDKDFYQLQSAGSLVKQFSTATKKYVKCVDPHRFLKEHILKGDVGDGIPNVLSSDDTLIVEDKRQNQLRQKQINEWIERWDDLKSVMSHEVFKNFLRNKKLISFEEIPPEIELKILTTYENQKIPHKTKLLTYLVKNRCGRLVESINEFF